MVNDAALASRAPKPSISSTKRSRFVRAGMRVLDVGTGSGAIACTIAAERNAQVDATDASPSAIAIASENARRLNVEGRCTFYLGDLTEPVRGNRYYVVIANLPASPLGFPAAARSRFV